MREAERIERITKKLAMLWDRTPDWRFFQMIYNHGFLGEVKNGRVKDPFFLEDDLLEAALDEELDIDEELNFT